MSKTRETIIEARDIRKSYGLVQVLEIPQFVVYKGAMNFLLGTNGSGKTTLLKILSLVDQDYQGQLLYNGAPVQRQEAEILKLRRKMAVIWQNPYLYAGTVTENIGLPLKLRQVEKEVIAERVVILAKELGIEHLLKKGSKELSAGEKQKVSIARSLIVEPEVLFVDEPTTNLDFESNQFFNDYFIQLTAQGMTILMITHDLHQIKTMAEYITVLRNGKVDRSGYRDEVEF